MAMAANREETGGGEKRSQRCELCEVAAAAVHCESDEARLCWGCDARVHGANFLVSRHVRALLCRRCFSPTPWRADGARLSTTISICHDCSCRHERKPEGEGEIQTDAVEEREVAAYRNDEGADVDDDDTEEDDEGDSYDDIEEEDEDEEEEEGENQVVPLSSPAETATTTTTASSSSSSGREEEDSSGFINQTHNMFLKRMRELSNLTTRGDAEEDDDDDEGEATSYPGDFRRSKRAMAGRILSFAGANNAH